MTSRLPAYLVAFAVLLAVGLGFAARGPRINAMGDNGQYLCMARSLAAGHGYYDSCAPGLPAHTKYPPGYPLILAPLVRAFPDGVAAWKIPNILLAGLLVLLTFLLARRYLTAGWSGIAALVVAASPHTLICGQEIQSEMSYAVLSLAGLYLLGDPDTGRARLFVGGALLGASALIRMPGVFAVAGYLVWIAWRQVRGRVLATRSPRTWVAVGLLLTLPTVAWVGRNAVLAPERSLGGYYGQLVGNPYDEDSAAPSARARLTSAGSRVREYAVRILPDMLLPWHTPRLLALWDRTHLAPLVGVADLLATLVCLLGLGVEVRRRLAPEHTAALLWGLLLVNWFWTGDRFLFPLLPVIVRGFLSGVQFLAAPGGRVTRWIPAATVTGLLLLALVRDARLVPWYRSDTYPEPTTLAYYETARWARATLPADAVLVARKPACFALFAERATTGYRFTRDQAAILAEFDASGVDYVVRDSFGIEDEALFLDPLLRDRSASFPLVFAIGDPAVRVYRYLPGR